MDLCTVSVRELGKKSLHLKGQLPVETKQRNSCDYLDTRGGLSLLGINFTRLYFKIHFTGNFLMLLKFLA